MSGFAALPDDGTPAWPTAHLRGEGAAGSTGKRCVLLMTGAMSPIHRGHVEALAHARRTVERHGWRVLGGYVSPSNDNYVGPKSRRNGSAFVDAAGRVHMARLATEDIDWIDVGAWEARVQNRWPNFTEVIESLDKHLSATFSRGEHDVLVFYVCGADHASKCIPGRRGFRNPRHGLVVIDRAGSSRYSKRTRPDDMMFGCAGLPEEGLDAASSTMVRKLLRKRIGLKKNVAEEATRLLSRRVYQLICETGWYGCSHGNSTQDPGDSPAKKGKADNMVENLDLLDAVSRVHNQWLEEGRKEAVASLDGTDEDALRLGLHHGSKLGYELAYMDGVAKTLLALSNLNSGAGTGDGRPKKQRLSKRARATALGLQERLTQFPLDQPATEDFQKALDLLRAQFRMLCAQAKIPSVCLWQNGGKKKEEMSF